MNEEVENRHPFSFCLLISTRAGFFAFGSDSPKIHSFSSVEPIVR
jgi:hypothetical protein